MSDHAFPSPSALFPRLGRGIDREAVVARITQESGLSGRYGFMTAMSAGIAMLGLLLSSPAVIIGAMLISPLMNPILGLGFGLAIFDFKEIRRSAGALAIGSALAILFTAVIVLASPLKAPTAEILARTRPNLFDLLVALFAALAGSFAIIRGRGETITGVAIATALMPPLGVVGYGLATANLPVAGGAFALFLTNLLTIALSATVMARLYGFGHHLSARQTTLQTWLLILTFVAMAVPLGVSLARIAQEALTVNQVRALLSDRFGSDSRVTQLDVDFDARPVKIRSVVIAPASRRVARAELDRLLAEQLHQPVDLQLDQVLLAPGATALEAQRAELEQAREAASADQRRGDEIARLVAIAAGLPVDAVTIDRDHHRVEAGAAPLEGASLATYWALERRIAAAVDGWAVTIHPPVQPLPEIAFAGDADALSPDAARAVSMSGWAAKRWNVAALGVPGLPAGDAPAKPTLAQRRAIAIAAALREQGVAALPRPVAGARFRLDPSPTS